LGHEDSTMRRPPALQHTRDTTLEHHKHTPATTPHVPHSALPSVDACSCPGARCTNWYCYKIVKRARSTVSLNQDTSLRPPTHALTQCTTLRHMIGHHIHCTRCMFDALLKTQASVILRSAVFE